MGTRDEYNDRRHRRMLEKLRNLLEREDVYIEPLFNLEDVPTAHTKVKFRCACGKEHSWEVCNFLNTKPTMCPQCLSRTNKSKCREIIKNPEAWKRLRCACKGAFNRCFNKNTSRYPDYGGRGITVEFPSPVAMAEWIVHNLGYPPQGCSLDRIDNSGNYAPGNLRWATYKQQRANSRPITPYKRKH